MRVPIDAESNDKLVCNGGTFCRKEIHKGYKIDADAEETEKSISVEHEHMSITDENIEVELHQIKGVEEPVELIISSQVTSQISCEGEIKRTVVSQDLELDDNKV